MTRIITSRQTRRLAQHAASRDLLALTGVFAPRSDARDGDILSSGHDMMDFVPSWADDLAAMMTTPAAGQRARILDALATLCAPGLPPIVMDRTMPAFIRGLGFDVDAVLLTAYATQRATAIQPLEAHTPSGRRMQVAHEYGETLSNLSMLGCPLARDATWVEIVHPGTKERVVTIEVGDIPETVAIQLVGRPLTDLLDHPVTTPLDLRISEVRRRDETTTILWVTYEHHPVTLADHISARRAQLQDER